MDGWDVEVQRQALNALVFPRQQIDRGANRGSLDVPLPSPAGDPLRVPVRPKRCTSQCQHSGAAPEPPPSEQGQEPPAPSWDRPVLLRYDGSTIPEAYPGDQGPPERRSCRLQRRSHFARLLSPRPAVVHPVHCGLRIRCGRKDRPLVAPQHLQPRRDIGRMVRPGLRRQRQVGADESRAEFRK